MTPPTPSAKPRNRFQMREFLNVRRVPPTLREKIQRFYTSAARHQVLQEDDVIHHLSAPLRTELVLFLYRNTLEKVPFFQGQDPHFITALLGKLNLEYYGEGDVVVAEGDVGNVMYFVVTGQLEGRQYAAEKSEWVTTIKQQSMKRSSPEDESENLIMKKMKSGFGLDRKAKSKDDSESIADQWQLYPNAKSLGNDYDVVSKLHPGDHFGEYGCLLSQPRSATIVALEFCELYSLTRDDLMDCYQQWPKLHEEFLNVVSQFAELLNCETPKPGGVSGDVAAEPPDSPPLIQLPSVSVGDQTHSASAAPDTQLAGGMAPTTSNTPASTSESYLSKPAGQLNRLGDDGRRTSSAGMQKAAKLVMNMQHLDCRTQQNPVLQLLNEGNDLKSMMEKTSSSRQRLQAQRNVSKAAAAQSQVNLPGTTDPEIGTASNT